MLDVNAAAACCTGTSCSVRTEHGCLSDGGYWLGAEAVPVLETELAPPETVLKPPVQVGAEASTSKLRFAEDVLGPGPSKSASKARKKKKKGGAERSADDGARGRRQRRERGVYDVEGEEY